MNIYISECFKFKLATGIVTVKMLKFSSPDSRGMGLKLAISSTVNAQTQIAPVTFSMLSLLKFF
jgi:hypothetical protein